MPSMTTTYGVKYARTIVNARDVPDMKRKASRRNRRANRQRLHEQGEAYEPVLIRLTGWDVA